MKATYRDKTGNEGTFECPVVVPQTMQHVDGFTLVGFDSWEDVNDEKLSAAVTNIVSFKLIKKNSNIGFAKHDED